MIIIDGTWQKRRYGRKNLIAGKTVIKGFTETGTLKSFCKNCMKCIVVKVKENHCHV